MSYLTSSEAGAKLRMSARQVTILCAKGELRASKSGRQWLVDEDDIDDYLDRKANRPRRRRQRVA